MFRTKKDVDRHSQEVLQKILSEKERNLRCLSLAQLYYNVQDYESAKRYVLLYLSVKNDSSLAHKLLGQCYEQCNDKSKALQEYIVSLQADSKQAELVLKVCELICENDVFDKNQAKHWFAIGEEQFPYHPTILRLKKKLFLLNESNYTSLEASLTEQIRTKPNDAALHTQLLTFYVENGRIREAYDEAFKKPRHFTPIIQWYQCAVKICKMYKVQFPNALQEDFYANNLLSLERLLALAVQDVKISRKSITECVSFLARFDETLSDAVLLVNKSLKFQKIISHMCGQLCFHSASIIYRKLKWEDVKSPQELNQLISPLLLLSTSKDFKIVEDRSTNDSLYRTYNICVIENAYRMIQTEFVLHGMAKGNQKEFIEKIFHLCVGDFWKERISEKIYSTSDYAKFRKTSFFMTYAAFSKLPAELPSQILENIEKKINITETVNPISLHHLVWLGVNFVTLSDKKSLTDMYLSYQFYARKFSALPFCNLSSSTTYAESLCRLDVDAFLYASVFSAKSYVDQQISSDKYYIFPADVSKTMCSPEQEQWWEYAYQMCSKTIPDGGIAGSRSSLQRGIEAVRLSGSTSLPVQLLVLLGRTFSNRAAVEPDSEKASALEERAALYWKAALPILENIARNETVPSSPKSIFEYHGNVITKAVAITLIDEGKRIVGMHLIKSNDYSDSVCEQVNESYGDLNVSVVSSNAGASVATTLWGDKIIQSMLEQNAKITDKLETLYNKQELLCSNQFQLLEMISTLTKKVEAIILPNYDEYLDKLTVNNTTTAVTPGPSNIPTGFPSGLASSWTPTSTANLQQQQPQHQQLQSHLLASLTAPKVQNNFSTNTFMGTPTQFNSPLPNFGSNSGVASRTAATASFMQKHPHLNATPNAYALDPSTSGFGGTPPIQWNSFVPPTVLQPAQPLPTSSIASKLEPSYGAVSGQLSYPQQNQLQTTGLAFVPPTTLSFSFSSPDPKVPVFGSTNFESSVKVASTTVASTPPTSTATPVRPSYHIPMPDISSIIQSSPPVQIPQDEDDDDEVEPIEHDPIPDFKPIIPLPDEVAVETGEEGEEVVYQNRARLFRFVDKEWKERGTGTYKLLKNPTTGRVRALMRREMVHKVCANHLLSEETQLSPMKTSDRAWIYCAADYADEKVKVEQFCIKFKNPEEAAKFKDVFDKYREESVAAASKTKDSPKNTSTVDVTPTPTKSATPKAAAVTSETPKKPNDAPKITPKSGLFSGMTTTASPPTSTVAKTTEVKSSPNTNAFVFGAPKLPSNATSAAVAPTMAPANLTDKSTTEPTKPSPFAGFGGFSLNTLPKPTTSIFQQQQPKPTAIESKTAASKVDDAEPAPFSNVGDNVIDFSKLSQSAGTAFSKSKDFKGFSGAGSLVFGGAAAAGASSSPVAAILKNILPQSPKLNSPDVSASFKGDESSLNESAAAPGGGAGDEDEFVPDQEFAPVIPLPELIDVRTGEEGLTVLFEERCKLFRYTGTEWKERGVGNMKILRDPATGHVRLLMRREQVHKVCCNHRVLKEHEMKPHTTSDKAWTWCAQDFSENELKNETFCVKFKTVEQANAFRDAYNKAKSSLDSAGSPKTSATATTSAETSLPKLSDMFKPQSGTWECKMCYVRNKEDVENCVSCDSPKDPSKEKPKSESTFVDNKKSFLGGGTGGTFTFGMPSVTAAATATAPASAKESLFGSAAVNSSSAVSSTTAPASTSSFGFSFGNPASSGADTQSKIKDSVFTFAPKVSPAKSSPNTTTTTNTSTTFTPIASSPQTAPSKSLFSFGGSANLSSTGSIFNTTAETASADSTGADTQPKPWFSAVKPAENASIFGNPVLGTAPSFSFGKTQENISIFGGTPTSKSLSTNTSLFASPESTKSANTSGAFSSFSFKLPNDLSISAVKNDSNSQDSISFYEKAPLLLLNDTNEIKLLKSRATLYRRAQHDKEEEGEEEEEQQMSRGYLYILKNTITCKFRLLFKRKPSLMVYLSHYIDETMSIDSSDEFSWSWFASDFSKADGIDCVVRVVFDDAEAASEFENTLKRVQKEIKDNASDSPASSEVEFISETKPTDEEKKLAESLCLPANFFAYKYQKDCPGCIGCDEEDRKKKEDKENQSMKNTTPQFGSLFSNMASTANKTSLFGGFNIPASNSKPNLIFGDITNNTSWMNKNVSTTNQPADQSPSQKPANQDGSEDEDEVVKNDHDPYFEPIVPLPDIVEVKTGEESEEIKFCERSKLFRFDDESKQWKERGVGELKVLYHPAEKSYRLLMRREQVHKVVLNQRITSTLSLQPLPSSRTSWCWFGMNLPEQESEPILEKLAAKFKTEAQATAFYDAVQESLFDVGTVQNDESAASNVQKVNESSDADDEDREYGEGNYDDTNYEEEYDDREYEDGDDEYEPDYYVDEEGIGDAMEELDVVGVKEVLFENEVHVEVLEGSSMVEYDGVIKLVKKYDEDKEDDVGCVVFSTPEIPALYKADIVEGMNAVNEGNGSVAFVELNAEDYERKMVLQFENEDVAEEFAVSFRTLNIPACPKTH